MSSKNILGFQDVMVRYGDDKKNILDGISIEIPSSKTTMVLGKNGSGKTTLLNTMLGFIVPIQGSVQWCGETQKSQISYIPQIEAPISGLSVFDFVLLGRINHKNLFAIPQECDFIIVNDLIKKIGLEKYKNKSIAAISGGEFQKVRIARALAQQTHLILMDEPTTFLDYGAKDELFAMIKILNQEGKTVVLTSHEPELAVRYADYVILMQMDGSVISGRPKEVITSRNLLETFSIKVSLGDFCDT